MTLKERFKFAKEGNYNDAMDGLILGAKWDKSADPTLVRTDGAVGLVAQAGVDDQVVVNDFDRMPIFGEMREVTDHLGNVFIRIPKFYIQKIDELDLKIWRVSKKWREGFYLPWCFYDFENDTETPYIDVGKYSASQSEGNVLESKPGTSPLVSTNIVNFRNYARNNNQDGLRGYQQMDIHVWDVLQTLMYIEFATLNLQSVMYGFTSGRYGVETELAVVSEQGANRIIVSNTTASQYRVGQTISIGTARYGTNVAYGRIITAIEDYGTDNKAIYFDGDPVDVAEGNFLMNSGVVSGFSSQIASSSGSIGDNTSGKYPCMYRGIENPYGNIWQFVDGINVTDHQTWVCKDAEQYASNLFAAPYERLGYVNSTANGYAKYMGFDPEQPFAETTAELGTGSSTYYCDYYYQNTGQRIARAGGAWSLGSFAGPAYWALDGASSFAIVTLGGRLLKKPL